MADQDDSAKTEEPTSRRLEQGRERGQIAVSQDLNVWAGLAAASLAVAVFVPNAARSLTRQLTHFIQSPEAIRLDVETAPTGLADAIFATALTIAPILLFLAIAVIAVGVGQSGLIWASDRIEPKLERLSPLQGAKRLLGPSALVEFVKGALKVVAVGLVVTYVALPEIHDLDVLPDVPLGGLLVRIEHLMIVLLAATAGVMAGIAGLDYLYQRFKFVREMRMSRQEIRDEYKDTEGDPHIKARIRRIRTERARKRMMAAVPKASVVITNPTHFAVALSYDMQTMPAPKLVAKGADLIAQRIRALAVEHGVPVVENPPLARTLFAAVEIDQEVPPQHYQAVAEIIGYVLRLGQRRQPA